MEDAVVTAEREVSTRRGWASTGLRYVVVGGLSFGLDAGMLFLLHGVAGMWLPMATGLAFAFSFLVNFVLNRFWAFEASGGITTHFLRYGALVAANWVVTIAAVPTITWSGIPYLWAKALCTGSLFVLNFLISRRWIYT